MFFSGMEEWLRSGDISSLDNSKKLKNNQSPEIQSSLTIKTEYLNDIPKNYREMLLGYEGSLKNISLAYRQISYRLKPYAENYLATNGMENIIK